MSNQDFNIIYDWEALELSILQEGSKQCEEQFEAKMTTLDYHLTSEELEIELRPVKDALIVHEVLFSSAVVMKKIIDGMCSAKRDLIVMKFRDTSVPITIETLDNSDYIPGQYNIKNSISSFSEKITIMKCQPESLNRIEFAVKFLAIGAKFMEKHQNLHMRVYANGYLNFSLVGSGLVIDFYIPSKDYQDIMEDVEEIEEEDFDNSEEEVKTKNEPQSYQIKTYNGDRQYHQISNKEEPISDDNTETNNGSIDNTFS